MGRNIYLKDKEMEALKNAISGYIGKMEDIGEGGVKIVKQDLENGLGSAMLKLNKGTLEEKIWKTYANK